MKKKWRAIGNTPNRLWKEGRKAASVPFRKKDIYRTNFTKLSDELDRLFGTQGFREKMI